MSRAAALVLMFGAAACSSGGTSGPADATLSDGGAHADAAVRAEPTPPAPPEAPDPVRLTPCPEGWREVAGAACDPWPETGRRTDCAPYEAHFLATEGCARIGTPAGPDGFPIDLPTDRMLFFVDDDAAPGGTGLSRARAVRSIAQAIRVAPDDAVIAIADGHYDEVLEVLPGQTLWGASVEGTILTTSTDLDGTGTIQLLTPRSSVRNLSIVASENAGVISEGDMTSIESVIIDGAKYGGVLISAGRASMKNVSIRNSRTFAAGVGGFGFEVIGQGAVDVDGVLIEGSREIGVALDGAGATLTGRRLAVLGTIGLEDPARLGHGMDCTRGSLVDLREVLIDDNRAVGALARLDSRMIFRDVIISATRSDETGEAAGAEAYDHGTLELERARFVAAKSVALVAGAASSLTARDIVVEDVIGDANGSGFAIYIESSTAYLERVSMAHGTPAVLFIESSTVTSSDIDIRAGDNGSSDDAFGLFVSRSRFEANRLNIAGAVRGGAGIVEPGTHVTGTDWRIEDIAARPVTFEDGDGIFLVEGAQLELDRVHIARAHFSGLFLSDAGTRAVLKNLEVEAIAEQTADELFGTGAWVQSEAHLEVENARFRGMRMVGVAAIEVATGTLREVVVDGVDMTACAETTCRDLAGGFGLSAHFGATLDVADFVITNAAVCGVAVGIDSAIDLAHGVITRAEIGACVQNANFDTVRLRNDVEYRELGVPLQTTNYTLPDTVPREVIGP